MARRFGIFCIGIDSSISQLTIASALARDAGVEALCSFSCADLMSYTIPESVTWMTAYLPCFVLDRMRGRLTKWIGDGRAVGKERLFLSVLYQPTGWEGSDCAKDETYVLWMYDGIK